MRKLLLPAFFLAACAPAQVDMPFDSDGDGLLDSEELEFGTDDSVADSDSDNWLDGEEVASFTDPLDPNDHPYTGGWPIGSCRNDLGDGSYNLGETVVNTNTEDQFGDYVKLHDFCDTPFLLTYYVET
jgi:hypothetical protein